MALSIWLTAGVPFPCLIAIHEACLVPCHVEDDELSLINVLSILRRFIAFDNPCIILTYTLRVQLYLHIRP